MLEVIIAVLGVWCAYNTFIIWHNERQDKRASIIDKCTLRILQIHSDRLDRLDKAVGLEPFDTRKYDQEGIDDGK